MKMRLKLPIRYKYVVTTLALVTLVVSIITLTMANLFHNDKKSYIHDLAVTAAAHTAEETTSILRSYVERLHVFGRFILDRDLAQSKKKKIIENMFTDCLTRSCLKNQGWIEVILLCFARLIPCQLRKYIRKVFILKTPVSLKICLL